MAVDRPTKFVDFISGGCSPPIMTGGRYKLKRPYYNVIVNLFR